MVSKGWEQVARSDDFWTTLKTCPGVGLEIGRQFNRLQKSNDIFFMTSRCGVGVQRQTCQWLYDNLGINYPNVIVVQHFNDKWPLLKELRAKWFIDDKLETMQGWVNYTHMNRLQYGYWALIDQPWNRQGRTVKGMQIAANVEDALKQSGLWA